MRVNEFFKLTTASAGGGGDDELLRCGGNADEDEDIDDNNLRRAVSDAALELNSNDVALGEAALVTTA